MTRQTRLAPFILISVLMHLALGLFPRSAFDPIFPRSSIATVREEKPISFDSIDFRLIDFELPQNAVNSSRQPTEKMTPPSSVETVSVVENDMAPQEQISVSGDLIYLPPVPRYVVIPSVRGLDIERLEVVLEILVDETGKPQQVNLPDTLGLELKQRLKQSAMLFRFEPATKGGVPTTAWVRLPLTITAGGSNR